MHVVQHFLGALGPDLVVAGVPEEPDADHDVAFERQPLLRLQELLLEARASAKGYDGVVAEHLLKQIGYLGMNRDKYSRSDGLQA